MTSTNTRPAGGGRAPIVLLGAGALAMAALETLNPGYSMVSETLSRYVHGTAGRLLPAALPAVGAASAVLTVRIGAATGRAGRATDGLTATRTIVQDRELTDCRVIVLTTFETDEYVFAALAPRGNAR
ncbi:hypothetical protein LG634_07835 [Streptomyces bambusae]|nr:hypothetical protein [Streptomyces bambusae]